MAEITEGRLIFHFDNEWSTLKYDDASFYRKMISQLPIAMKAMDIIAANNQGQHLWFEIKDCLGYEAESQPRLSPSEHPYVSQAREMLKQNNWDSEACVKRKKSYLAEEIIQKLNDTLLGAIIAKHKNEAEFSVFHSVFSTKKLKIIVFLTLGYPQRDYNMLANRLERDIRSRLSKLTQILLPTQETDVIVCNENTIPAGSMWSVTRSPTSIQST